MIQLTPLRETRAGRELVEEGRLEGWLEGWREGWLEGWLEGRLEGYIREVRLLERLLNQPSIPSESLDKMSEGTLLLLIASLEQRAKKMRGH